MTLIIPQGNKKVRKTSNQKLSMKKIASTWTDLTNNFEFGEKMTLEDLDHAADNVEGLLNDFVKANDFKTLKQWIQEELVDENSLAEGISVDDVAKVFIKYVHPRHLKK